MLSKLLFFGLLLSLSTVTMSCGEDVRTSLNVEERKEVNEKYKEVLDSINKSLIAECETNREKKFEYLVDSLKKTRLEEILLITKKKKK